MKRHRPSDMALFIQALLITGFLVTLADEAWRAPAAAPRLENTRRMVREWLLTDLALFTEARYTRHLSQADLFSPFQDHPLALEHFPSGSLAFPSGFPPGSGEWEGDNAHAYLD